MQQAVTFVAAHPGCAILPVALAIRPHHQAGHTCGYAAVHRAIKAGLIQAARSGNVYSLTVAL